MKNISNVYDEMHQILTEVNYDMSDLSYYLNQSRSNGSYRQALEIILENKWISNLDYFVDLQGNINVIQNGAFYLRADALRFINFYEKFGTKNIDLLSMTMGDAQLVEYYANKDKYSLIKSLVFNIIVILITAISTAIATKYL